MAIAAIRNAFRGEESIEELAQRAAEEVLAAAEALSDASEGEVSGPPSDAESREVVGSALGGHPPAEAGAAPESDPEGQVASGAGIGLSTDEDLEPLVGVDEAADADPDLGAPSEDRSVLAASLAALDEEVPEDGAGATDREADFPPPPYAGPSASEVEPPADGGAEPEPKGGPEASPRSGPPSRTSVDPKSPPAIRRIPESDDEEDEETLGVDLELVRARPARSWIETEDDDGWDAEEPGPGSDDWS